MLSQTIPHFPFHDQEGFFATLAVSKPGLAGLLRLPAFLARYPRAALQSPEANRIIGQRINFYAHRYFPFHAVKWVDADGGSRFVRYTWQPTVEETSLSKAEAKQAGPRLPVRRAARATRPGAGADEPGGADRG